MALKVKGLDSFKKGEIVLFNCRHESQSLRGFGHGLATGLDTSGELGYWAILTEDQKPEFVSLTALFKLHYCKCVGQRIVDKNNNPS